jgi:hypothetical protein
MTRIGENLWPAQQPPLGFTDATVERLLAATPLSTKTTGRHRWMVLAMAAVFCSGMAYGWGVRGQMTQRPPPTIATLPHVGVTSTMQQRVKRVGLPEVPALQRSSAVRVPPRPSAASAAPPPEPRAVAPSSAPKIPACQCERGFSDVICDCY